MPLSGRGKGLASVFRPLAADVWAYALDLVIKAALQRDVSLIKLSAQPPLMEQIKCLSQL